ncbi:MAG: GrpB family protein [Acidimicrobiales bacterium]
MLAVVSGPPSMSYQDYDPRYPLAFERLVTGVQAVLPAARIEHVGSTSVPGLGGRRVIDAVVIADDDAQPVTTAALLAAGFTHSPFSWIQPTLTTSVEVDDVSFPVLLYVLAEEHPVVRGWLATRDHWRSNRAEADRYAQVKRAALSAGHVQPWAYQQAKTPYLDRLSRKLDQEVDKERSP